MIGPERGRYRDKVSKLVTDAQGAERAGFASIWVPQIPDEFDALTAVALMGDATTSIELGTAVMPIQTRHPVAMAQQALADQAVCEGRFVLGLGPSHHWIVEDMLGLVYDRPARQVRDYLEVLNVALAGPGRVDVENDSYRVHNDIDVTDIAPTPVLVAALAPVMLRIAGELASGTILWMADERAIGDHVVPRITKAAGEAGKPSPRVVAGVPVALCANDEVDAARGVGEPCARPCGVLPELSAPARARRCDRRRRSPRGRRRVRGRYAVAVVPRRGRHGSRGARASTWYRPWRAHRVPEPHRGLPRFAVPGALTPRTLRKRPDQPS